VVEYAEGTGLSYSQALRAVLDEKPLQPRRCNSTVLEATTKLDVEIHRLMVEEHVTHYHEGMHHVLSSTDPWYIAIVRAYEEA
jgi:hypothetical protein